MRFMRIIIQEGNSAFFNMALDEAISDAVRKGLSPPTLRIYQWDKPSISIGYFQRITDINIDYCKQKGYPIVRRPTGGRAILHDIELTYSLSTRFDSNTFKGRLREDYSAISRAILSGLRLCGIEARINHSRKRYTAQKSPACFKFISYSEIIVNNKKVTGSAQKRYTDGFLQQGSIPISIDRCELRNVLKIDEDEGFDDIGTIREFAPEITINELRNAIKRAFENILKVKMISDGPTKFEMELTKRLESEKYSTDEWNLRRRSL